jgi:predicted transposase YdaD
MEGVGIKLSASANKNFNNMYSEIKDKNFTKAKKSLGLITGVKKGKTVKLQAISKILIEFALNIKEGNAKTKKK